MALKRVKVSLIRMRASLAVLAGLLVFLWGCAQRVFYYPDQKDYSGHPDYYALKYEDITFPSLDGTKLHGWFVPAALAEGESAKGTVIHFHGNAGNMTGHWFFVSWLPSEGYNLFVFDYRGYGESEGRPSRKGLAEDADAAINYVRQRKDIDPGRLLILGQSLGGNVAIAAVGGGNRNGIKAVVVDSTFYSYRSIANSKIPGSGILINNNQSASDFVERISPIPLLIIHGNADAVVPCKHSQWLYDRAKEPKQLLILPGIEHIEAFVDGPVNSRRKQLLEFFDKALN